MPFIDHFSLIAPYYERIFSRPNVDLLAQHVKPQRDSRLLDVGGGTGRIAQYFVQQVAQVCVLDPSPLMLREGQLKGICITQGESEQLPYATGAFDRIIMIDAFHHLCDQRLATQELLRVLAPEGRLVIEEPDVAHWAVRLVAVAEKLLLMRSHFYTPLEIQRMFVHRGVHASVLTQAFMSWVIIERG
jgi:ubiquinone/menaquinone biosynthesis C-methylase UbiE